MMAYKKRIRRRFILLWLGCLVICLPAQNHQPPVNLPLITRAEILENARRAAEHRWLCREENTRASCAQSAPYSCDFAAGDSITGIAYDWGGMDDDVEFERKLRRGQAAGSHSRHGVTGCTTGMDCSGFVSYCWGQIQKYGTTNIRQIAGKPRYNWFTDMKPGDVFNKPGSTSFCLWNTTRPASPWCTKPAAEEAKWSGIPAVGKSRKRYIPQEIQMPGDCPCRRLPFGSSGA
jgi:hypothetical protein